MEPFFAMEQSRYDWLGREWAATKRAMQAERSARELTSLLQYARLPLMQRLALRHSFLAYSWIL